jgi:formylglycine-generating enzyme required for sulfatase activity
LRARRERPRLAAVQAEEERKAKAAAEAEARAKAERAEKERLAALKAEEERKAKAAAEAEARAKAEQAEKERLAALKAEEERKRAEAAARPDPALAVQPGSRQSFRDRLVDGQPCPTCPEMVVVPAGDVMMGSPENERGRSDAEGPQRRVTIASPLAIGKFSITRGEFAAFVKETDYRTEGGCDVWTGSEWRRHPDRSWRSPNFEQDDRQPIILAIQEDPGMFDFYRNRPSFLTVYRYADQEQLLADLGDKVIRPAELKVLELRG